MPEFPRMHHQRFFQNLQHVVVVQFKETEES